MLNKIEKEIVRLFLEIHDQEQCITSDFIEEKLKVYFQMCSTKENLDDVKHLVKHIETVRNINIDIGASLINPNIAHDIEWVKNSKHEKLYSKSYEEYLVQKGMPRHVVNQLSRTNEEILSLLGNPESEKDFLRRGLVIGDVQSGKTSNYLSLITQAADAGYKFIIVIAGIHNNLRKQTQQRVEEGFIGRSTVDLCKKVGVSLISHISSDAFPYPISLTTQEQDFNKNFATQMQAQINDFPRPVIVVIKKNVTTLKNLYEWLTKFNLSAKQHNKITVPMLMIDDESDNASINTNDSDLDPTRTNQLLRDILHVFTQRCYVGYTATPFANIFIDPESYGNVLQDLFPEEFIYSLDAPTNYFGPNKIFLNDDFEYVISLLDDDEVSQYLPEKHKKTLEVHALPESLERAIQNFLLAKVIRNIRGDEVSHCSMLINVSPYVSVQQQIKSLVIDYLGEIRNEVMAYGGMFNALDKPLIRSLYNIFKTEYVETKDSEENIIQWSNVLKHLIALCDDSPKNYQSEVFIINSKSKDILDYDRYTKDEKGLMAIVIGGFSLSRGLTIEGLTISYFHRSTKMYDTLLQMGRWFGYRPYYEDLCRIYMTSTAYRWYQHISQAALDLKQQIIYMNQARKTPRDFGLYVKASDEGLIITARNKMRTATSFEVKRSFTGELKELYYLTKNPEVQLRNQKLFNELWQAMLSQELICDATSTSAFAFSNVTTSDVIKYLNLFEFGFDQFDTRRQMMEGALSYLYDIQNKYPMMDVTFMTKGKKDQKNIDFSLIKALDRTVFIDQSEEYFVLNRSRVGGQEDESHGLLDKRLDNNITNKAKAYRERRKKPLLLIYFINPIVKQTNESCLSKNIDLIGIPTFALSFPYGDENSQVTQTIYANKIYEECNYNMYDPEEYEL